MGRVTDFALPWNAGPPPEVSDELTRWIWAESGTERQTRERTDGATITYPGRNNALASLGGSMRRRGMSQPEIEAALIAVNATRVEPPLTKPWRPKSFVVPGSTSAQWFRSDSWSHPKHVV